MTDQELSTLGERIYGAIIAAQLSEPALLDLLEAVESRCPWSGLNERTKISVFVVASQLETSADTAQVVPLEAALGGAPPAVESIGEEEALASGTMPVEQVMQAPIDVSEPPPDLDAVELQALANDVEGLEPHAGQGVGSQTNEPESASARVEGEAETEGEAEEDAADDENQESSQSAVVAETEAASSS